MKTVLASNVDIALVAIGTVMIAAAITVLAGWPWALLTLGATLTLLGTLVIE